MKLLRSWKKVYENDVEYIVKELREIISTPALVVLTGDLGVGKTTFTRFFIGQKDVPSPTYSIINEVGAIVHADFYRVEQQEEITHLELSLYLEDKLYFFVEWGLPYVKTLNKEVPESFFFYEIEIDTNKLTAEQTIPSRNYILKSLER